MTTSLSSRSKHRANERAVAALSLANKQFKQHAGSDTRLSIPSGNRDYIQELAMGHQHLHSPIIPNSSTANLANVPVQILEIHALTPFLPLHRANHLDILILEPALPHVDFVGVLHGKAEVLLQHLASLVVTGGSSWLATVSRLHGLQHFFRRTMAGDDAVIAQSDVLACLAQREEQECRVANAKACDAILLGTW